MGEIRNKKKFYTKKFEVKLTEGEYGYIKKRAKEEKITMSELVRRIIIESSRWKTF